MMTPGLKSAIRSEPDTAHLRKQATADGMRPLRMGAAAHVSAGLLLGVRNDYLRWTIKRIRKSRNPDISER
ncbi:MAG: hypothetical protein R3F53_30320 [Gammaproteobacteria bacterium]